MYYKQGDNPAKLKKPPAGVKREIMKNESIHLSAYAIYWVEFRPIKGIATIKDMQILGRDRLTHRDIYSGNCYMHFGSIDAAKEHISAINSSKLSKHYEVRFFTDKQYGMRSEDSGYKVPFTAKQNDNVVVL